MNIDQMLFKHRILTKEINGMIRLCESLEGSTQTFFFGLHQLQKEKMHLEELMLLQVPQNLNDEIKCITQN